LELDCSLHWNRFCGPSFASLRKRDGGAQRCRQKGSANHEAKTPQRGTLHFSLTSCSVVRTCPCPETNESHRDWARLWFYKQTFWILDKGDVDQLDRNKEPVLYGFADMGFLNSRLESPSFQTSARGTLTSL